MKLLQSMALLVFLVGIAGKSDAYSVVQSTVCVDNATAACATTFSGISLIVLALIGLALVMLGLSRRKRSVHVQVR